MPTEQYGGLDIAYVAASDMSAKQFYAVKLTSTYRNVDIPSAATDLAIGIVQNNPTSGHAANVRIQGVTQAVSDGTTPIAIGDYVGTNNAGKMVKKATPDYGVVGIAQSASAADGTIIDVLLEKPSFFRSVAG